MKILNISEVYSSSFNCYNIFIKSQPWNNYQTFDWINKERTCNAFMYFKNCEGHFQLINGDSFFAHKGAMVYLPMHSNYRIIFQNVTDTINSSYIINFYISDDSNEEIIFSRSPFIITNELNYIAREHIESIANIYKNNSSATLKFKTYFYNLILSMDSQINNSEDIRNIMQGIEYLNNNLYNNITLEELSKMSNVSVSSFIRIFKKHYKTTPKNYIMEQIIEKAKEMLVSDLYNINEISGFLGFSSSSYFCYLFKLKTGKTPSEYKIFHSHKSSSERRLPIS